MREDETMIRVYHNKSLFDPERPHVFPWDWGRKLWPKDEDLELVAVIDGQGLSLEDAYRLTNNIDHSWAENDQVTCLTNRPRSTSCGDVIELDGKRYVCAANGWAEYPTPGGYVVAIEATGLAKVVEAGPEDQGRCRHVV